MRVIANTGLQGRWMCIDDQPKTICDTGHNSHAFLQIIPQVKRECKGTIHWILGSASDKDFKKILKLLPSERSKFYWTSTSSARTTSCEVLAQLAHELGLTGDHYYSVNEALLAAKTNALQNDLIFIGGSTFVVADLSL